MEWMGDFLKVSFYILLTFQTDVYIFLKYNEVKNKKANSKVENKLKTQKA